MKNEKFLGIALKKFRKETKENVTIVSAAIFRYMK
jgi:hypothetical protein